jgi:hypothetical protein
MALVTLDRVWVNQLATGEAVSAFSAPERPRVIGMDGEVRTYAGGRRRSVTAEGVHGQWGGTLRRVTKAVVDTLESWLGETVQVRDHRGLVLYGVFYQVTPIEIRGQNLLWDVALVVNVVTAGPV